MSDDGAAVATGVFGGLACVCLVCLFVLGVPLLLAGIVMLAFFPETGYSVRTVAIVFVVIASLMVAGGILFAVLTCVCATKSTTTRPRRNMQPDVVVASSVVAPPTVIFTTGVNPQPTGYIPPPGMAQDQQAGQPQFYHPNNPTQPPPYQAHSSSAPPPYYDQPPPYNPQHSGYNTAGASSHSHAGKPMFT